MRDHLKSIAMEPFYTNKIGKLNFLGNSLPRDDRQMQDG